MIRKSIITLLCMLGASSLCCAAGSHEQRVEAYKQDIRTKVDGLLLDARHVDAELTKREIPLKTFAKVEGLTSPIFKSPAWTRHDGLVSRDTRKREAAQQQIESVLKKARDELGVGQAVLRRIEKIELNALLAKNPALAAKFKELEDAASDAELEAANIRLQVQQDHWHREIERSMNYKPGDNLMPNPAPSF